MLGLAVYANLAQMPPDCCLAGATAQAQQPGTPAEKLFRVMANHRRLALDPEQEVRLYIARQ